MGVVHRAVHRETGVEAALKTVRLHDPALLAGLRREVRALSRLAHPGIVRILDVGLADETPWYAMELLVGQTLGQRLRSGTDPTELRAASGEVLKGQGARAHDEPPSERRAELLAIFPALCDALAFLHGEGVVHLDLKPDNVFLVDGQPRLMDFGLAARAVAAHGREALDVVGPGVGTVAYIAPEQIRAAPLDARADLYAVGCMLFEVITGTPPFAAENAIGVLFGHLQREPVAPSTLVDGVPPELDALVLALLAKDPDARIGYAADVARTLRALLGQAAPADAPRARDYLYRPALVGRDRALESLRDELTRAGRGETRVVFLEGESGVGKTRLAIELARREAETFAILTGECRSLGAGEVHGAALAPFDEVFHAIADRCRERGEVETQRLLGTSGSLLATYAPVLAQLPGAETWTEPEALPARAARARLVTAMCEVLFALAREKPLLLLLDDVQWADDITLAVLSTLLSSPRPGIGLLVLATCRSEERHARLDEVLTQPEARVLALGRLDGDGARQMASSMLGRAELPAAMVDRVSEHAEGNPFFIAEYLRAAVREEVLRRVDGRWSADDPDGARIASLPLPHSIRDLVERRFARLGPLARSAAEIASVIGRDVEPDALAPHLRTTESALTDALQELLATQLMEALPDGRLRFVHAKLHEGVYQSLGQVRRASLHVAVGEAIEAGPARPGRAAVLAHHYTEGRAFDRALDQLERAGLEALASGSYSAAATLFERARTLSASERLAASDVRRARWERGLGDARFALGDLVQAAAHGRAALELLGHALPASGFGASLAVARESVGSALVGRGSASPHEAAALTEAALAALRVAEAGYYALDTTALIGGSVLATTLAGRAGVETKAARAYAMLGLVLGVMRMKGPGLRLADRATRAAERGGEKTDLAFTLYVKASVELCYRDFEAARGSASRAAELARSLDDQYDAGVAETILGHCEYFTGRLTEAAERYARLARTARACRASQHEAWGLYAEARSLVHTGECERAVELCEEARKKLVGQNDAASELICQGLMAWALLGVGDASRAREAALLASDLIRRSAGAIFANIPGYAATCEVWLALHARGEPGALARATEAQRPLSTLALGTPLAESTAAYYAGRLALARGETRRAARHLTRAMERADAHGMALDAGLARLALARVLSGEPARRAETEARATLTRIGAHRHLQG